jgi:lipopolysaccharide transport system ATP-binding protein
MNDIAHGSGRTIIFVSHNMAAIESLCSSCVLVKKGRLEMKSTPREVLSQYLADQPSTFTGMCSLAAHPGRRANSKPAMQSVTLYANGARSNGVVRMGSKLDIVVSYAYERHVRPLLGVIVETAYGAPVFCVSARFSDDLVDCVPMSQGRIICSIDDLRLMPGSYTIDLYLGDSVDDFDAVFDAISFEIVAADLDGSGRLAPSSMGPMFCTARWSVAPESADTGVGFSPNQESPITNHVFPRGIPYP